MSSNTDRVLVLPKTVYAPGFRRALRVLQG